MDGGRSPGAPDTGPFTRVLTGAEDAPEVVGEKGAAIARMHALGLPVAPAFAVTTHARRAWARGGALPRAARAEVARRLDALGTRAADGVAVRASPTHAGPRVGPARLGVPSESDAVCRAVEDIWRASAGAPVAVVVQRCIAARGERSGRGVVVSRNPLTAAPLAVGCYEGRALEALRGTLPAVHRALEDAAVLLESAFGDMCEVTFAIERGRLWLLGARRARRAGAAAIRVAVDLVDEALIAPEDALRQVPLWALEQAQAPVVAPGDHLDILARGVGVAPGA